MKTVRDAILIDFPFLSGTCPEQGGGVGGRSFQNEKKKIIPESEGGGGSKCLAI